MSTLLSIAKRNAVLSRMATLLEEERASLKSSNQQDLDNYSGADLAMKKRLLVDDAKIDGMILSMQQLASQEGFALLATPKCDQQSHPDQEASNQ